MTDEITSLTGKITVMLRMLREEYTKYIPIDRPETPKDVDREVCRGKIQILTHVLDLCQENSSQEENIS